MFEFVCPGLVNRHLGFELLPEASFFDISSFLNGVLQSLIDDHKMARYVLATPRVPPSPLSPSWVPPVSYSHSRPERTQEKLSDRPVPRHIFSVH